MHTPPPAVAPVDGGAQSTPSLAADASTTTPPQQPPPPTPAPAALPSLAADWMFDTRRTAPVPRPPPDADRFRRKRGDGAGVVIDDGDGCVVVRESFVGGGASAVSFANALPHAAGGEARREERETGD